VKGLFTFLKTTILGGLLVIIPLFLVYLILAEAVDLLVSIVQPIAEMLPKDWIETEREARILSFLLLVALCFLTGLVTRTHIGISVGNWLERTVLHRMPGYRIARTLTRQFTGSEEANQFAPAVMRFGDEDLVLAYIIEEHDNGYLTLLLPGSPVGTAGGLRYVPGERVKRLKAPLGEVFNCITQYGIGSGPLFTPHTPGKTESDPGRGSGEEGAPEASA
jgi:uncharacterized membrane protein